MSSEPVRIAVIGGSGLYKLPQLSDIKELEIETPFGAPSDKIVVGKLNDIAVAFVARHGRGHSLMPSDVPYQANIYALKRLGVEQIIAVSACGSLREDFAPGHIVIPDQLVDFTKGKRAHTFFSNGLVAHTGSADPFCTELGGMVNKKVVGAGGIAHSGGSFITVEGPRFSTKAESHLFRSWGMSLIGMTTSPEAFLAREAEICYTVMAHVTDYDVWHESEEPVSAEAVFQTASRNLDLLKTAIADSIPELAKRERDCDCQHALAHAISTDRRKIPTSMRDKLAPIIEKYLPEN